MNKQEFDTVFSIFCGAYNKKPDGVEFVVKAHWIKLNHLSEKEYMDLVCQAIDTHTIMPSVGTLLEIKRNMPKPEQPAKPLPTTKPRSKKSLRDYFVIANKDIEGKKRHHIEHLDLVKLYDNMRSKSRQKQKPGMKKLSDCFKV